MLFSSAIPRRGFALCALALSPLALTAQTGQNGSISGLGTGPDNAPVAHAAVTLTGNGLTRRSASAIDGTFSLSDLPSGTYTVQVAAPGFSILSLSGVPVALGRNTQLNLSLHLAGSTENVSITASPSTFDSGQTSSVVNIDRERVEELPIPNRNYLSFVALSPQATPANPAIAQQTGNQASVAFGFGGLRPSSNAIRIDGVSGDDEYLGSSRTQLSPEAISDFQIVNHGFAAESGGAAGGTIDVQTRSGAGKPHGDAFIFIQNGALNGTPPLESTPAKPDESRVRVGTSLGGTVAHENTFYYLAAEQESAHGEDTNDLRPATLTQINSALQRFGPLHDLSLRGGFFPVTDQEIEISGRLDRALTPRQTAMLRYAFTNSRNVNDAFNNDDLTDRTARGSSFIADNSLTGMLSSALGTRGLNRLSFQLAQRRAVQRTGSTALPGVLVPGVVLLGTPYFGNGRRFETHLEFEDELLLQAKRHLFQAGAGVDRVAIRSLVLDGNRGLFVFPSLNALSLGTPDFFTETYFRSPNTHSAEYRVKAYLQDHWTAAHGVAVDFGLRYEANQLPAPFSQHPINFSPRVGLAWRPVPSLILRSGFGIFYDRFLLSTVNRLVQQDGSRGFLQNLEGEDAAALYRHGRSASQPIAGTAPSIARPQPGLHNPYSQVASFSAEQALPFQVTLKAEFQYVHGLRLGRTANTNLLPPVVLNAQNAAPLGIVSAAPQQFGRAVFLPSRANPAFDSISEFSTTAGSNYNGLTFTLNRQFTEGLQILAGYTLSKTFDDASFDSEQPQNPFALADERSLSLQDQRHRFTLSGIYLIGPDSNDSQEGTAHASSGPWTQLLNGLEFAPILSVGSGFRANPVTGLDSNREHVYPFTARPLGLGRNSLTAPANINFDLRILKILPVRGGHLDVVAESFNLLNHRNVSLLDTAYGSQTAPRAGFGAPIATSTARRIQFSLDFEF